MFFSTLKMVHNLTVSFLVLWKPYVWEKFSFSLRLTMFSTNQTAVFSDYQYIWKESIHTFDFFHGDNHQGKVWSETTTFGWVQPVVLLVQSDCRILWSSMSLEGIIWYLCFLCGDNHQGKAGSETTAFGWVWPGVPFIELGCSIYRSSVSL